MIGKKGVRFDKPTPGEITKTRAWLEGRGIPAVDTDKKQGGSRGSRQGETKPEQREGFQRSRNRHAQEARDRRRQENQVIIQPVPSPVIQPVVQPISYSRPRRSVQPVYQGEQSQVNQQLLDLAKDEENKMNWIIGLLVVLIVAIMFAVGLYVGTAQ